MLLGKCARDHVSVEEGLGQKLNKVSRLDVLARDHVSVEEGLGPGQ